MALPSLRVVCLLALAAPGVTSAQDLGDPQRWGWRRYPYRVASPDRRDRRFTFSRVF
jgi:hypothetical protein